MKTIRILSLSVLVFTVATAMAADALAPHDYAMQYRNHANEPPSRSFPLGTDELGRDRFSRLLQGSRISLLCAPAAAVLATALAVAVGLAGGSLGGWTREVASASADLFLSLPWLFALLLLRALLPLNISPYASIAATFALLAAVGWAWGARIVLADVMTMMSAPSIIHARASGAGRFRVVCIHILPNLRPVVSAQFWVLVPVFLLTEANLGVLGLGIVEPMPSWGNMLAELQNYEHVREAPWILAPALVLVLVVSSLHLSLSKDQSWQS